MNPDSAAEEETLAMADERVKMECPTCGYKSIPQWLNDEAHCLKCQAVLKRRPSCQERSAPAVGGERRAPGEASTNKYSASSAMESASGDCAKSPDGVHHWKYGKCNYCQKAEGKISKGAGVAANPGGGSECPQGGKCIFKFAKCSKCGRAEGQLQARAAEPVRSTSPSPSPRLPDRSVAPPSTGAAGAKIADVFRRCDKDGNGTIDKGELRGILMKLASARGDGFIADGQLDEVMDTIDVNRDGIIDYEEFSDWVTSLGSGLDVLERMKTPKHGARPASRQQGEADRPASRQQNPSPRGPERFFYDKSSYTGTHQHGGPASVAKGSGTASDQSWKRPN